MSNRVLPGRRVEPVLALAPVASAAVTSDASVRCAPTNCGSLGSHQIERLDHYFARSILRAGPLIFGTTIAVALYVGWIDRDEGHLTPETGTGYWLGIVGASMMLLLLFYPLRKRFRILRHLGKIPDWFRLHMVLGILGPTLILFHGNFKLGSLNSNVGRRPHDDADRRTLLSLVDAECEQLRLEIVQRVRERLSGSSPFDPSWVLELLDSRHGDVRARGSPGSGSEALARDDVALWHRLIESPHDDVRLFLVAELKDASRGPRARAPSRWIRGRTPCGGYGHRCS